MHGFMQTRTLWNSRLYIPPLKRASGNPLKPRQQHSGPGQLRSYTFLLSPSPWGNAQKKIK